MSTRPEFCQYADRYLRLTGISSQPEEHWEINSIKVNSIGIPDPDNAYAVKLKDKSAASQVELTPEGIIKAINTTSPIEKAPVTKVADTAKKRIDPRSFMTEEILIAGSTAKMAELVAKEIYNIRESKNSLTRGQADYMPKDGAALKLMLDNLDEQEQAMMQMFAGTTDRIEKSFTIRIKPEADMKEKVAFRFSKKLGMLDADNLSGEPYYISIVNQETLPPMDPKGKEKTCHLPPGGRYNCLRKLFPLLLSGLPLRKESDNLHPPRNARYENPHLQYSCFPAPVS